MADLKISQLPVATTPLAGTEVLPIVQSGTTKQVSVDNFLPAGTTTATNTQTLTNKTISGASNTLTVDGTNAVGFRGIPSAGAAKTTSYTLTVTDIGELVEVGSGGSITVPNSTFAAGDAVVIFNNTTGAITLTMSITTAYIGGTDTDKATISLATRGICNVLFISGTVCVVTGNVT
jgi:hypothetical protein